MRRKEILSILLTIAIVCLVIPDYARSQSEAKGPIKLGCLYPITGPMQGYGLPSKAAIEYTCELINAKGGILGRKVEPIIRDVTMEPEAAIRFAKDLIMNQGCTFISGSSSSATALAVSEYVRSLNGKALWTVYCATASQVTEEKFHRYVSRVSINTVAWSRSTALASVKLYGKTARKLYCINPDYVFGHECRDVFVKYWEKMVPEAKVVGESWPPLNCSDFNPYITSILGAKPDVVQSSFYGGDALRFLQQGGAYGLLNKVNIAVPDFGIMPVLNNIRKGDVSAPIGVIGATPYPFYLIDHPDSVKFYKEVYQRSGWYPCIYACNAYQYVLFLKAAMEKAGTTTDVEKIIDALEGVTIDWFGIPIRMRAYDHQTMHPLWVGVIGWDPKERFPMPILTKDVVMLNDYDQLYHSPEEIAQLRSKAKK